jgi:hypothetical protein
MELFRNSGTPVFCINTQSSLSLSLCPFIPNGYRRLPYFLANDLIYRAFK